MTWFGRVLAGSPGGGAAPRANFKLQVAAEGAPRRPPTKDPGRNRPVCPPALPGTRLQRASWQAGAAVALMGPQQRRADSDGLARRHWWLHRTLMPGHPDSGCEVQVNMQENMREYAGKNQMGSDHGEPNRHFEPWPVAPLSTCPHETSKLQTEHSV